MTSIPTNQAIQAYAQAAQALSGNGQGGANRPLRMPPKGFGALIEQQATNLVNEGQAFEAPVWTWFKAAPTLSML
jgi:hypothetical protein